MKLCEVPPGTLAALGLLLCGASASGEEGQGKNLPVGAVHQARPCLCSREAVFFPCSKAVPLGPFFSPFWPSLPLSFPGAGAPVQPTP